MHVFMHLVTLLQENQVKIKFSDEMSQKGKYWLLKEVFVGNGQAFMEKSNLLLENLIIFIIYYNSNSFLFIDSFW